ncbi:serine/threonine-protein kinase fray2-like [Oppia nitens]|uniref:serine/threonine-protein kinase fray2-like n=1 Tax=Oppia nitens TaxID=1686743 RepID=UPI0023D9C269|nr:serine/threonine-protein kinase fray2-like [Oppia nitens]
MDQNKDNKSGTSSSPSTATTTTTTTTTSSSSSSTTTTDTNTTPKVDDFMDQLTEVIDAGSHGILYKVQNSLKDQSYAVKVATLHECEERDVLETEILCLMSARSKYVTAYYDHKIVNDQLYLLMDISTGNLQNLLDVKPKICRRKSGDPIGVPEFYLTAWIFKLLLEAVNHIHSLDPKIIHRDIIPKNILIEVNGFNDSYVKLCDFGVSTQYPNVYNKKNTTNAGTTEYRAPEVRESGSDYDHRADIYSVSIVGGQLFELTNHNDIDILEACDSSLLRPGAYCRERLAKIYDWLCRMHRTNPAGRPDCGQVLDDFGNWNFPMDKIMMIWMANYNYRFWKLVPPVTPDQPNEENVMVRAGLDRYDSLQKLIAKLETPEWSELLDAVFTENRYRL